MAHGHVHTFELTDKSKLSVFNLQFMNKDEMGLIKNALDKVMPKDRNEVYNTLVKVIGDMMVTHVESTRKILK